MVEEMRLAGLVLRASLSSLPSASTTKEKSTRIMEEIRAAGRSPASLSHYLSDSRYTHVQFDAASEELKGLKNLEHMVSREVARDISWFGQGLKENTVQVSKHICGAFRSAILAIMHPYPTYVNGVGGGGGGTYVSKRWV